jgi:hypothetical protein
MAKRLDSPLYVGRQLTSTVARMLQRASRDLERIDRRDAAEVVHGVRTTCKRVRGIVRLARPGLAGHYRPANQGCRDAARLLSPLRDRHVVVETFDALVAAEGGRLPAGGVASVRAGLVAGTATASATPDRDDPRIVGARRLLDQVGVGIAEWPDVDAVDAVDGIAETYRRGRAALEHVLDAPSIETFHEWRKRVKYLWYQVQLIRDAAPSVLRPLATGLHDIADALGDDHDLAVLIGQVREMPEHVGPPAERRAAIALADARRTDLQAGAIALGRRLYVESPVAFADRIGGYLTVWEEAGPERPTGALAALSPPDDGRDARSTAALRREARERRVPRFTVLPRAELIAELRARS